MLPDTVNTFTNNKQFKIYTKTPHLFALSLASVCLAKIYCNIFFSSHTARMYTFTRMNHFISIWDENKSLFRHSFMFVNCNSINNIYFLFRMKIAIGMNCYLIKIYEWIFFIHSCQNSSYKNIFVIGNCNGKH